MEFTLVTPSRALHSESFVALLVKDSGPFWLLDVLKLRETDSSRCLSLPLVVSADLDFVNNKGGSFRNKMMTAQSSILDVGYLRLQPPIARATNTLAAMRRFFVEATILMTSVFVRTSHT